jgi:hypothetical protein
MIQPKRNNKMYVDDVNDDSNNDSDIDNFSMVQIDALYFIAGSTFRAMVGTVEDKVAVGLIQHMMISLSQAIELKLPYAKVNNDAKIRNEETNEVQLFCASQDFFDVIISIEKCVLVPIFGELQFLQVVGAGFYRCIYGQLKSHNSYVMLVEIVLSAV